MSRTGGEQTRARIMREAERLFAANGYAETSVDNIAKAAKVNKALIYYYFKSKDELLNALFKATFDALEEKFSVSRAKPVTADSLRDDLAVVEEKKRGIGILFMEAMRSGPASDFLFDTCELMAAAETKGVTPGERLKILSREFYTGVVPYMVFLMLKDKWCARYKCSPEQAARDFAEIFMKTHVNSD